MVVGAEEDAAGIGEAELATGEFACGAMHFGKLARVLRMVGLIGAGEVAHDEADFKIAACQNFADASPLFRSDAEARHAGVELQNDGKLAAELDRRVAPALQLLQGIGDWSGVDTSAKPFIAWLEAIQHVEACVIRKCGAQLNRFDEFGDEEVAAAFFEKGGRHLAGAKAVGVCLDHAGGASRRHLTRDQRIVPAQRLKVDRQMARRHDLINQTSIERHVSHIALPLSGQRIE
ncbi:hypothetical protein L611_000400000740 [Aminobacter sp. J15]|nr:hypothetical protein L611_000400000740 [Aminobacter sp. J15]